MNKISKLNFKGQQIHTLLLLDVLSLRTIFFTSGSSRIDTLVILIEDINFLVDLRI